MLPEDLITPKQASRLLGVHVSTIHRWVDTGRLKGYRRATCRKLVRQSDVEALIVPIKVVEVERPRTKAEEEDAASQAMARLRGRGYKA